MGFRFSKRVKIMPGVHLNFGKRGVSTSIGPRGAKLNLSSRGIRQTVGLPGTGLSFSRNLSSSGAQTQSAAATSAPAFSRDDYERLGVRGSNRGQLALISAALMFLGMPATALLSTELGSLVFFVGLFGLAVTALMPSKSARAQREIDRRRQLFEAAAANVEGTRESLQDLLQLKDELRLTDDEAGRERIAATKDTLAFHDYVKEIEANDNKLVSLTGHESVVGDDACFLVLSGMLEKHGPDDVGDCYITNRRLIFKGSQFTAIEWKKVDSLLRFDRRLEITVVGRRTPFVLHCRSLLDALKANLISENVWNRS